MRKVFISYSRDDSDFVEILRNELSKAGIHTWQDIDIRAGEAWPTMIDDALKDALALVLVLSPQAKQSPYVNYEWAFALGAGVTVIPLLLKLDPAELHLRLRHYQYLDFRTYATRPWDKLIRTLREIQESQRGYTVRVPRDAPPAIHEAAHALDSLEPEQREAAIESLGQMKPSDAAREVLAEAVKHPVRQVRLLAAMKLAEFGDARALPELFEGIKAREFPDVMWKLLAALGKPAVEGLIRAVRDEEKHVREDAARALRRIGDAAAVPALKEAAHDQDAEVRATAVWALGAFPDMGTLPEILAALRDPERNVRLAAMTALGSIGGAVAATSLAEALLDTDSDVRTRAAVVLGEMKAAEAVPALLDALADPNDRVRCFVVEALGEIGHPAAVQGLLEATKDEDDTAWRWAFRALGKIGGAPAVAGLLGILRDRERRDRDYAAQALGGIGDPTAVPVLIEAMRDPEMRPHAVAALAMLRDPSVVRSLVEALNDAEIAESAASALKSIATPEALAALKAIGKRK